MGGVTLGIALEGKAGEVEGGVEKLLHRGRNLVQERPGGGEQQETVAGAECAGGAMAATERFKQLQLPCSEQSPSFVHRDARARLHMSHARVRMHMSRDVHAYKRVHGAVNAVFMRHPR